jgi:starch phosphorylase
MSRLTTVNTSDQLRTDILGHLHATVGRFPEVASRNDWYLALAYAIRQRVLERWVPTVGTYLKQECRTVCYLSAEFLIGPQLGLNLLNLDLTTEARQAVAALGQDLDQLIEQEEEPGLGNGGLGRLAACYLDSMSTLEIPAIGYGIRYEFGIFDQLLQDGWQMEIADRWLRLGYPWEVAHPETTFEVKLGGHTERVDDKNNGYSVSWIPERIVIGTPCDTLIPGYRVGTVSMLRLWRAEASNAFDFTAFNVGDYYRAVREKIESETITKVLYPNDEAAAGKQLRLEQQYFFTSCSLQDMIRIFRQRRQDLTGFDRKYAIQLNDTHPSLGIAELMRLLIDEHGMPWEKAWDITRRSFAYTNHTLLPEALEKWPMDLLARVLPRPLEIILEINRRFLGEVERIYPKDLGKLQRLSLVEEGPSKQVRMAHLACVGSHAVNGVAEIHTRLLSETVLHDFYELDPKKFSNKTNGVSLRRFLALSNPPLARLITDAIGDGWIRDADELVQLAPLATDASFCDRWQQTKLQNKQRLAEIIRRTLRASVDPHSMFDMQAKRIHEYKRQHLNILHVLSLYLRIKRDPTLDIEPRTVFFAGKAAPGYFLAKLIIKLINSVAQLIDADPQVRDKLKVLFLPDFNVKNSHAIYPAADLSEQISTAGKEASGTGNMKFAFNGALTIGTLDGANVEIREAVGADAFFLFGLSAEEVRARLAAGYRPWELCHQGEDLREVIDLLSSPELCGTNSDLFQPLVQALLSRDEYLVLADYHAYVECQNEVAKRFADPAWWTRASIQNVSHMGKFSADRAVREYCRDIWQVEPVPIAIEE